MNWLKKIGLGVAIMALTTGVYTGYLHLSGNFHEVIAGEFYRSGQLSAAQFSNVLDRYKIKTVINLRGTSERQWYKDEVATAASHGVKYVVLQLSARRQLTLDESKQLIALMRDAPKPLLVHCQGGADRSGLASLLYVNRIAGVNEDVAELQLSPLFGHFGIPYLSETYAMDESWDKVEDAFGIEATGFL